MELGNRVDNIWFANYDFTVFAIMGIAAIMRR